MFALAIYDTRTRTLILARDRFGIKPLFYAPGEERLAFASEIRALLELPELTLNRTDKRFMILRLSFTFLHRKRSTGAFEPFNQERY